MAYLFPFGQELHPLVQQDRSPKKVFVLGVYASAVHAKWKKDGQIICQALAVASEPCIFWNGKDAKEIIDKIAIPAELGYLEPAVVKDLSREEAVLEMVDFNIHREKILPSEKAFANKMKMDVLRNRTDFQSYSMTSIWDISPR